ncbi:MAG TPA: ribosome maturation factor RimP [Smithella sp.]|jgi:ribosome maturation factor RimP|nr:ribosome maturation factor RimP [Smithella sp.]HNQ66336.1 ribosome maturation factor RimP [Smithella sp.]HOE32029.1 ribosome maturation factor RimP [Smithella sp.]HOG10466.1 ribosome maturation factor RimP [Smithella sp.]HOO35892.1 ribosome maturation factor RimP [Smithella sp.]
MDFDVKEKIRLLAEPVVASEGMELIHVECIKMHTRWIIRLFLDKEGGITLEDCTNISNQLGDIFDIREVVNGSYTLEVSSPGFDRPISRDQDFLKYRNSRVDVKTGIKIDGVKNFHGVLLDYIEENGRKLILVEVSGKVYRIPRQEILKANLADEKK